MQSHSQQLERFCAGHGFSLQRQPSSMPSSLGCSSHPQIFFVVQSLNHVRFFATPWTIAHQFPLDFPGKNTGVGCHFLLQGIFLTQKLNSCLLHCRQILYCLSYQGSLILNIDNPKDSKQKLLELINLATQQDTRLTCCISSYQQ